MKYKIGDKVKLKNRRGKNWNTDGEMDKYIGKTVTIKRWGFDDDFFINDGSDWFFDFDDIESIVSRQFTKSDLKDNHIVVLRNNTKILYTRDTEDGFKKLIKHDLTHSYGAHLDIMEVWEFDKLVWKREEKPVEILDKEEKKWLNHFIKSTNIKVNRIVKYDALFYNDREFLNIYYNINDDIESTILPYFKKGSMYQGMELDKKYTLKELGLE